VGWKDHGAHAVVIWPGGGAAGQYVRVRDPDGNTVWQAAKPNMHGGPPSEVFPNGERLTPAELAEILTASLE
jgi:hypothetical protein